MEDEPIAVGIGASVGHGRPAMRSVGALMPELDGLLEAGAALAVGEPGVGVYRGVSTTAVAGVGVGVAVGSGVVVGSGVAVTIGVGVSSCTGATNETLSIGNAPAAGPTGCALGSARTSSAVAPSSTNSLAVVPAGTDSVAPS